MESIAWILIGVGATTIVQHLPKFFHLYRQWQIAYGQGYKDGRLTAKTTAQRALAQLVDCKHGFPGVCDGCSSMARGELAKLLRGD